jgi:hypothetical protein
MTITIATPDRQTVTALTRSLIEPVRLTRCLRRASSWFDGARVVDAQCVSLPLGPEVRAFRVCGELQLPAPTNWATVRRMAIVLADELRADGFSVE